MRLSNRFARVPLALLLLAAPACDGEKKSEGEGAPAAATAATAATAAPAAPTAEKKTLAVHTTPEGLPTEALDAAAFIEDPCIFADTKQVATFLTYLDSEVMAEKDEQRDRGRCNYKAAKPETDLLIWFSGAVQLRSSESKITLAGIEGVTLRVLEESVEISIPFEAAKDSSKMPANRIFIRFELYHSNAVPSFDPAYEAPDKAGMEAAAKAVAENLITRLGLAK